MQMVKNDVVLWLLAILVFVDDLVLMPESLEDLRIIIEWFTVCLRRGLRMNIVKSKEIVCGGEDRMACDVEKQGE